MISLYERDLVMLMELYIYVVMGQSQFIVVLAFKLFSFLSYIFIVVAKCCNCTCLLALRNILWAWIYHCKMCCVVCLDSREYQLIPLCAEQ